MPQNDLAVAVEATKEAASQMKEWAKSGSQVIADAVAEAGEMNLARRAGGGRYSLSVSGAQVTTREGTDGWEAVLQTPWLGMEFGGYAVWYWGFKAGTSWDTYEPMWAPTITEGRSTRGYVIGAAWTELEKSGEPTDAMVEATLAGWRETFQRTGLTTRSIR